MMKYLIPTSTVKHLIKNILVKTRGFQVVFSDLSQGRKRYFPDGEIYMRLAPKWIKRLRGQRKRVIVLHSGAPRPNEGLVELELILQILKDNQIKPIEIFFTYFPYGMQDKVFEKGETNTAENLIEKLVNFYRVRKIYIIDPHFEGRKWVKKYPIESISAVPILINRAKKDFGENILFLSPDIGGRRRTGFKAMEKERISPYQIKMLAPKISFKGRIIGVIDDLIKTGGTLLKFSEIAKKAGAKKVIALITHGVIPSGVQKIKKKYSKLYLTNTIKHCSPRGGKTASEASVRNRRCLTRGSGRVTNVDITDLILKNILKYD